MRFRSSYLVLLYLLAACPNTRDTTPAIHVAPGDRTKLLPNARRGESVHPARISILKPGGELEGPNAVGKPGDYVLENDEVIFVIDQLGQSAGFAESGGNLVDAADARTKKDELGQCFTYFGTFPRQGVYERIDTGTKADGSVWLRATGHELYEPRIEVQTTYRLTSRDRALLLETTLTNTGDQPTDKLGLGDAIQWGGAEKFAPGKAVGFKGESQGPFVGGVGRFVSYAVASTDGDIAAVSGGSWTDTIQQKDLILKPKESVTYARIFLVGERPDTASLLAELTKTAGADVGALELALVDAAGRAVRAPRGAKAILANGAGADVLSLVATDEGWSGEVPPGQYQVRFAGGGGRRAAGPNVAVAVRPKAMTRATLIGSAAGQIRVQCTDYAKGAPLPCKATFEGLEGTPTPDFGPSHAAGPAKHQVTTATGEVDTPLSPGKYRVTLSRGPEYALAQFEVRVGDGVQRPCDASPNPCVLRRVVDTSGYLATDFHQHTMMGADAPVAVRDRVIANAAEGVEVAVASEHNVVADLQPVVDALKLAPFLRELPGNEITTDASRVPWGHANVYPLPVHKDRPRGGAPPVRNRSATEVLGELRQQEGRIIQINHPRTGITGYFDQLAFDPKTGLGSRPGYFAHFDALEVWNGRNVKERARVMQDFFAMLATKHPVTAIADTDTHGIVGQEAGYPRTYVRVTNDASLDTWSLERETDLVRGVRALRDVVLTNGPFVRVSADRAPIGGIVRGPRFSMRVHVEAAPWVDVDTLEVLAIDPGALRVTGLPSSEGKQPDIVVRESLRLTAHPSGAMSTDRTLSFFASRDTAFVVIVRGTKPLTPVLAGDAQEIAPFAMTGAVWVDADGDGRTLGR